MPPSAHWGIICNFYKVLETPENENKGLFCNVTILPLSLLCAQQKSWEGTGFPVLGKYCRFQTFWGGKNQNLNHFHELTKHK